jgi:hypothetical protein
MTASIDQAGGGVLWNTNQRIDHDDLNNVAQMALQSLTAALARLLEGEVAGVPVSGFGDGDCLVTGTGGLGYSVAPGIGWYLDTTVADAFDPVYRPIVNPVAVTGNLAAHEADPRIDVISIGPATVDEESDTRQIWDVGTGSFAPASVSTLRRLYRTITITKGTAAFTPAAPATPAGHIKIAECDVPATSGAIVVNDMRPALGVAHSMLIPGIAWTANHIPGSGGELLVTAAAGQGCLVAQGPAVINGLLYRIRRKDEPHAVYGGSNISGQDRIDVISAKSDGTVNVTVGTPGTPPAVPATPANSVALAECYIPDSGTDYSVITDVRQRSAIGTAQLQLAAVGAWQIMPSAVSTTKVADGAITDAKMATKHVVPVMAHGAEGSNTIGITIDSKDADGNVVVETIRYLVEVFDNNLDRASVGVNFFITTCSKGTEISAGTEEAAMVADSDANGELDFGVIDDSGVSTATVWVKATPLNRPGSSAIIDITFA